MSACYCGGHGMTTLLVIAGIGALIIGYSALRFAVWLLGDEDDR